MVSGKTFGCFSLTALLLYRFTIIWSDSEYALPSFTGKNEEGMVFIAGRGMLKVEQKSCVNVLMMS